MADYRATIRMVSEGASDPGGFVVEHHRTPRAAIDVDLWSGGHLLHLAIASCLFNDILRDARDRGLPVDHLAVTANGDFDQNGSSGIRYAIEIRTSADRSEVERLVAELEANAIIPKALRGGTPVERATVTILTE